MNAKARIDLRLPPELKELFESAAACLGLSLTEFTLATLRERALEVRAQHERTVLSDRDRRRFLAILDDEEPSGALRRSAARYKKQLKGEGKRVDDRAPGSSPR